jgi:hypothetical protein
MTLTTYYLRFLTIFVVLWEEGGWIGYDMDEFNFGYYLLSVYCYGSSSFSCSIWFITFFSLIGFILVL